MAQVSLRNIGKSYGSIIAIEDFNLEVEDGEFLVLLGPSGCGKSTTLRMVAGLENITRGDLMIGKQRMNDVVPKDRGVAMVFQSYALYPHKTVFENMGMALKLQRTPTAEIKQRVGAAAALLGLTEYLDRKPGSLSGGQRQRVAIGRAIVRTPDVFLFDEPLSNLDAKLRVKMRMELQELHNRFGVTSLYVTHDQVEAMTLANRIVIMDEGVIAQVGSPREVYDTPANEFVAGFIGSPAMNFLTMQRTGKGWKSVESALTIPDPVWIDTGNRDTIRIGIRPEHLEVGAGLPTDEWSFRTRVRLTELLGADALLNLDISGALLLARVNGVGYPEQGAEISVRLNPERLHAFDTQSGRSLPRQPAN